MENFTKISEIFNTSATCLNIPFSLQLDSTHLSALVHFFQKQNTITELSITGQSLDAAKIRTIYSIFESKQNLKKLVLSSNKISGRESLEYICAGVKRTKIEYLDLSNNKIGNDCVEVISDLLEKNLLIALTLDNNLISKGFFSASLAKNEKIQFFSVSNNPLAYECISDLLGVLMVNKSLRNLSVKGISLEGPAPIKENTNGHLSKKEAIILKLAYVLRFSSINHIAIDIDSSLHVQLEELEKTLIKYNAKLFTIASEGIDWKSVKYNGPLMGIHKALKANYWLEHNFQVPKEKQTDLAADIEELVLLKIQHSKSEHCESFFSNVEGDGLVEVLKKYPKKGVSSAVFSINSSPRSPENPKNSRKLCNFPLAFSAETPQFTTSIKGMTFSPESKIDEKMQDIAEISSIDFEEKRCTPVKKDREKHLEEIWNTIKKLEINLNQQIEMVNYKVSIAEEKAEIAIKQTSFNKKEGGMGENGKYEREDKGIWTALSRIEKFMTNNCKKEHVFDKRIEAAEEEIKNSKENFHKILTAIENHKVDCQNTLKEKATKIDIEILEKSLSKFVGKFNFINTEIENFRKDISRIQAPNKQLESLNQEILKIKDQPLSLEILKAFESFQREINGKYSILDFKLSELSSNQKNSDHERLKEKSEVRNRSETPLLEKKNNIPTLDLPRALKNASPSLEQQLKGKFTFSTDRKVPNFNENFLPGEAESLVLSAIIDKANSTRIMESMKKQVSSRSISPIIGFNQKIKSLEREIVPSAQLQETLRSRGISIDSKGALTERRK